MSGLHVPDNPYTWLAEWLPSNMSPERPTMTVATIGSDGLPDARTLLLSEYDVDGFYFHCDLLSRKVGQLTAHPGVALVLRFPEELRQLTIQGLAEVAPSAEIRRAYKARSPYLQQLAWQNTHDFARRPLAERLTAWADFAADHPEGFSPPATWTGYLVRPVRLTFWSGHPDTASRRIEYTREATTDPTWAVNFLAG